MDKATKQLAREIKDEAKEMTSEVKETTLEAAEVIALALTAGFVGLALSILLFVLAIV